MTYPTTTAMPCATRTSLSSSPRPVSVAELKRAWEAVQAGIFAARPVTATASEPRGDLGDGLDHDGLDIDGWDIDGWDNGGSHAGATLASSSGARAAEPRTGPSRWHHAAGELVLPVIGCAGSMGTTTLALALATAATQRQVFSSVRVVECGSAMTSGLAAASTAELGPHPSGWRSGQRDQVLLQRMGRDLAHPTDLPTPLGDSSDDSSHDAAQGPTDDLTGDSADALTVLDVSLPLDQVLRAEWWLSQEIRRAPAIVLATWATVPGLRRLEGTLERLERSLNPTAALGTNQNPNPQQGPGTDFTVAVIGPPRKKWPRGVAHSAGPRTRGLLASDPALVTVPEDRGLAVRGLDSAPLPRCLVQAGHLLLQRTLDLTRPVPACPDLDGRLEDLVAGDGTQAPATTVSGPPT